MRATATAPLKRLGSSGSQQRRRSNVRRNRPWRRPLRRLNGSTRTSQCIGPPLSAQLPVSESLCGCLDGPPVRHPQAGLKASLLQVTRGVTRRLAFLARGVHQGVGASEENVKSCGLCDSRTGHCGQRVRARVRETRRQRENGGVGGGGRGGAGGRERAIKRAKETRTKNQNTLRGRADD